MVHPQLLCLHSHPLHKQVRCQLIPSPHLYLHPPLGRIKQPRLVPLCALTRLPRSRADVAEMSATSAGHVIASEGELDDRMAGGAGLPTFRRCKVLDSLDCDVFGAKRGTMGLITALRADGGVALWTFQMIILGGRGG